MRVPFGAHGWIPGALAAAALCAAGCGPARPGAADGPRYFGRVSPPSGNVFRFNNGAEPEQLDPALMSGQPDGRIARALFEGLTVYHPGTLAPDAGQARSWDLSADGRIYTFHLRPEARWTDGSPVTARDFLWSWLRVLRPSTGSRYASLLFPVAGAEAFSKGTLSDSTRVGLAAPDDTTFVVTLNAPTPYFVFLTGFYSLLPVPRAAVERWGERWVRPEHIVSNGPFTFHEWRPGDRIVLEKNLRYWDAARVRLDRVECYAIEDLNTSMSLYRSGAVDWNPSGYVPTGYIPHLRRFADLSAGPFQGTYYYSMNVTRKPFDDPRVRLALNLALDRDAIANKLLRGTRAPWGNITPRGYPGYEAPAGYGHDPARARRLLAEAGYPGGRGMRRIEILITTSEDHRRIAEAIQGMWRSELGVDVAVSNQEWGSYLEATTSLRYDVARRSWLGDYLDPNTFLAALRGGDDNNRTGWADPGYDRLLDAAAAEPDPALRLEMLARAEAVALERGPILPIYHLRVYEMIKPYVRGLETNVLDIQELKYVWIDHSWRPGIGPAGARAAAAQARTSAPAATDGRAAAPAGARP
ncbi:MAG: peptide ABC transporter substrate-binding protein [Candidatus Eisenbacteria bacterium]|nr:peptide ABC transporter substrate-binding protein [Candidatus Eisenbacteria bacterium]